MLLSVEALVTKKKKKKFYKPRVGEIQPVADVKLGGLFAETATWSDDSQRADFVS